MLSLKPASAEASPCKICRQPAPLFGLVDFNRNCEIPGGVKLPLTGTPVYYRRCGACGFLFTNAFDDWSHDDFKTHIYNDGYLAVDPGYLEVRPRSNAAAVQQIFGAHKATLRVLDYGGGNDVLCSELRAAGFPVARTYDPFVPEYARPPEDKFNLVTCFETLEHMPDPVKGIGAIVAHLADPGLVLFSTLLQPQNFDQLGLNWWYVGPRNGHISMFSRDAHIKAWHFHGFQTRSFNDNLHIAFRTIPEFAKHLVKGASS
ncbi:MAG TPA: class I SAM-dependent methyltransferase [Pseudolabrys sp.]|nr:class I SAM-dependent methyltransferase [Pseudolabrys sp.]